MDVKHRHRRPRGCRGLLLKFVGLPVSRSAQRQRTWFRTLLSKKLDNIQRINDTPILLQNIVFLLRQSVWPGVNYYLRALAPLVSIPPIRSFQTKIHALLRKHLRLTVRELQAVLSQLQLPLRLSGLGFPDLTTIAPIAFGASVVTALEDISDTDLHVISAAVAGLSNLNFINPSDRKGSDREYLASLVKHENVQKTISKYYHTRIFKELSHHSSELVQARLRSLRVRGSALWLSSLPTSPRLTISDLHYRNAIRIRLGLLPTGVRASQQCRTCHRGVTFAEDPNHWLGCSGLSGSALTTRHNSINKLLLRLCTEKDLQCIYEPQFPEAHTRPDLSFDSAAGISYISDARITHPCGRTVVRHAAHTTKYAATRVENGKHRHHADLVAASHTILLPAAWETFGAIGDEALNLLRIIRDQPLQHGSSPDEHTLKFYQQLASVALQIGNSRVIASARMLHNKQLRRDARLRRPIRTRKPRLRH